MTKAPSEVTSAGMKVRQGEAAERVGWGHTLDSAVKGGISEEGTLVAELVLWGSREEHFRSGYSK